MVSAAVEIGDAFAQTVNAYVIDVQFRVAGLPGQLPCSENTCWIVPTGKKGAKHQASYLQTSLMTSRSCVPVQLYCGWKISWTSSWAHFLNSEGIQNKQTHMPNMEEQLLAEELCHTAAAPSEHISLHVISFKRTTSWALSRSPLKRPQHVCIRGKHMQTPQIVSGIQANLWHTSHDSEILGVKTGVKWSLRSHGIPVIFL